MRPCLRVHMLHDGTCIRIECELLALHHVMLELSQRVAHSLKLGPPRERGGRAEGPLWLDLSGLR